MCSTDTKVFIIPTIFIPINNKLKTNKKTVLSPPLPPKNCWFDNAVLIYGVQKFCNPKETLSADEFAFLIRIWKGGLHIWSDRRRTEPPPPLPDPKQLDPDPYEKIQIHVPHPDFQHP